MVVFADPVLEAMVRAAMGKPDGDITASDAEAVTVLNLSFEWRRLLPDAAPIHKIDGLEYFKNLESLDLSFHEIIDVAPLAGLSKLTLLSLRGNLVEDISPLAGLTALTVLTLDRSAVSDLSPLAALTGIKHLYLADCPVLDYSPLADIYPNLESKDFIIPSTLEDLGFIMNDGSNHAIYVGDAVEVRINHSEWGDPGMEIWGQNIVRVVFGTDEYKVDIGYYPEHDTYVVLVFKNGEEVVNYLYFVADGSLSISDTDSAEGHVRAIFPDAAGEELLLEPIEFYNAALETALGMTAIELYALPFAPLSLANLGFVESEEVRGFLFVQNESGDYFDVSIHDPEQAAWEGGGEVRFFTPLSEEYRIVVTYHIDEKQFTVKADDNDSGGAEYSYFPGSDEYTDIWCSDDDITVEQYFVKAIDDPSITDASDVYQYSIKRMVKTVEDTFGMSIEELYALLEQ